MSQPLSVVTGANGFIGSHLVEHLVGKGHRVRCIVRASSNLKWIDHLDIEFVKCGLNEVDDLAEAFKGADFIFHLAGSTKAKHMNDYIYGNVTLTQNVLDAARKTGNIQRIVITSSLAASAPSVIDRPATEQTPSAPVSLYGKSKVMMERMVKESYADLPCVIVRPPVVYGPRDTEVLLFFKMVHTGLVSVIGFGKKQVSLVYIDDLVNGLFLSATQPQATGETFFFVSDTLLEWKSLGDTAARYLNKKTITLKLPHFVVFIAAGLAEIINLFQSKAPTLNWEKAKEITKEAWTCSAEKAEKTIGFKARTSYKEGFKITLDWYKKEKWL